MRITASPPRFSSLFQLRQNGRPVTGPLPGDQVQAMADRIEASELQWHRRELNGLPEGMAENQCVPMHLVRIGANRYLATLDTCLDFYRHLLAGYFGEDDPMVNHLNDPAHQLFTPPCMFACVLDRVRAIPRPFTQMLEALHFDEDAAQTALPFELLASD